MIFRNRAHVEPVLRDLNFGWNCVYGAQLSKEKPAIDYPH